MAQTIGDWVAARYLLERVIAAGGGGTVFAAHDAAQGRTVAVKLPRANGHGTAEIIERLVREGRALSLVSHRNVVQRLAAGLSPDNIPYLVLELLEGRSLQGLLAARRRLPVIDVVGIGCQLCDALTAAHGRGVIHRDVKPGNLFVTVDSTGSECLKLLDFGVVALVGQAQGVGDRKLSLAGAPLGTAEYMAPEQLLGEADVDHRCDIYGAGATLYECLTGTVPFEGTYGQVLLKATMQPLPPVREGCPNVPPALALAVEKALARDREMRFANAAELRAALLGAIEQSAAPSTALCTGKPCTLAALPMAAEAHGQPQAVACTAEAQAGPTPGSAEQRRRYPRAPYVTMVKVRRAQGSVLLGRSEDVSEGGLLVMSEQPCAQDEHVLVCFALPGSGQPVEAEAVARWIRRGRGFGLAGFEFVQLSPASRVLIRRYVDKVGNASSAEGHQGRCAAEAIGLGEQQQQTSSH